MGVKAHKYSIQDWVDTSPSGRHYSKHIGSFVHIGCGSGACILLPGGNLNGKQSL